MRRFQLCLLMLCLGGVVASAQNNRKMTYETEWKEIDKLYKEDRLPKSALEKVQVLYGKALSDRCYSQVVKAISYRTRLMGETEDDPQTAALDALKVDVDKLPQPAKSIVYTYIGDFFIGYYQNNQWQLHGRTSVSTKPDDFKTWSAEQLINESLRYYMLAVQDEKSLKQTPITDYRNVIAGSDYGGNLLPTLYDLLGYHVLQVMSGYNLDMFRPQDAFTINDPAYFGPARSFVGLTLPSTDTASVKYKSLQLYRRLLSFRLNELVSLTKDAVAAFIDLDLRRLSYVKDQSTYGNGDELYEEALKAMLDEKPTTANYVRIAYELAYLYKKQGMAWRNNRKSDRRNKLLEAYKLCSEIIGRGDKSRYLSSYVEELKREILAPELSFNVDFYQTPSVPILYKATYRNVDTIHFFIYPLKDGEYLSMSSYDYKEKLKGLKPALVHEAKTVSKPDYQPYSAEMMLQGLPQGQYFVVATNCADFLTLDSQDDLAIATTHLQVYGLSFTVHSSTDNTMTVYVTDRVTGKPIEGAKVETYSNHYAGSRRGYVDRSDRTYYTAEDGTVTADVKGSDGYYINRIVVSHGDKRVTGAPNTYGYYSNSYTDDRVLFFTDRSIYRPGQTVYFKGLAYRSNNDGENKPVSRRNISVELVDVNGKTVSAQSFTSNEFGSIQGSFTLPQGLLNGLMSLRTYNGSTYFSVEEYKRPTFDVTFGKVTETYNLNDDVKVSGIAKALAGYAVDNANVQYRVQRRVAYRFYCWWWPPVPDDTREIASGVLTTDGKGAFTIDFKALADDVKDSNLIYTYTVTADVTDVNGETRSGSLDLRISSKPLLVNVSIPDVIMAGEKLTFPVSVTNLNGEASPAKVEFRVIELKSPGRLLRKRMWAAPDTIAMSRDEFLKNFPQDPYGDEDIPTGYRLLEQVVSVTVDTKDAKEVDLTKLRNVKSGWYKIEVKARNDKGVEVEQEQYVQVEGAEPEPIQNMNSWLKVVKSSGEPGETAVFTVAGGEDKSYLLYEVMLKNKTVEKHAIEIGKTPERIEIPIKEAYCGGIAVQLTMVQNNRLYTSLKQVTVPYTNKLLDVTFTTFRDKLQPGEEERWTLTVKSKGGEKEAAEMVATLYDASLDAFVPHTWALFGSFYPTRSYYEYRWSGKSIDRAGAVQSIIYRSDAGYYNQSYPYLESLGFSYYRQHLYGSRSASYDMVFKEAVISEDLAQEVVMQEQAPPMAGASSEVRVRGSKSLSEQDENKTAPQSDGGATGAQLTGIATRQNFNETAFFYPQLRTNADGEILVEFTIPEALTRWKMLGFAHTQDFKVGTVTNELVTQKEVAVSANAPRFFRENDRIIFTAKVNNLTESVLNGKAMLRLYDATSMQPIEAKLLKGEQTVDFTAPAEGSVGVKWTLHIPHDVQAIGYKLTAQAGNHTDGEEKIIPVLTNSTLVTETMPFSVRAGQTKDVTFSKLRNHTSTTLRNHKLTLEYTSNPAWYAVQALPYLMEYPYECAEQTFSRFYANSLASAVANSSPKVKQLFDQWNTAGSEALLSSLEKNRELRQVMLEETPWVMQANNETERKKRVAVLFDLNRMGNELGRAYSKLVKMQYGNGGIPWFDGMEPSRFVTQHIVAGFAHLDKLNALDKRYDVTDIVRRGLSYLDDEIRSDYDDLTKYKRKLNEKQIGYEQVHYLYAASFSRHKPSGKKQLEAFEYYFGQAEKFWMDMSIYEQAMVSLTLHRYGKTDVPKKIIASLKERSQQNEEMGMYWNDNRLGYFWYQAPIETQALLIEAFSELANDAYSVEEMKIWLLRQKQTTDWRTTKATSEAIYALLMTGSNLLDNDKALQISLDNQPLDKIAVEPVRPEAGTGYVKTSWSGSDIRQSMGDLKATNPNSSGVAWGAMYWQYFEQLDKITSAETNLKMSKQLFLKKATGRGEVLEPLSEKNVLKVGDLVKVRMELRADRDFEYVHLKDMRASGLEPISTVSGYRYRDGLGYYESVKDASVNFFIYYLRKGTYVFEYDLRVSHSGDFSNGITTFQCMYAPEFSSHSEGIRVKVE